MISNSAGLTAIRITSIFSLLAISTTIGLFVLRYGGKHRINGSDKWYHVLLRYTGPFTGGLFFALGLIHVLPEANEGMAAVFGDAKNDKYRFAPMMATLAFCILLFLQRVMAAPPTVPTPDDEEEDCSDCDAETCKDTFRDRKKHHQHNSKGDLQDSLIRNETAVPACTPETSRSCMSKRTARGSLMDDHPHNASCSDAERIRRSGKVEDAIVRTAAASVGSATHDDVITSVQQEPAEGTAIVKYHEEHQQQPANGIPQGGHAMTVLLSEEHLGKRRSFNAFILLLALCFHSLVAGVALGMTPKVKDALIFFIAILMHKWAATVAISNSFALSPLPSLHCTLYIVLFSATTPFGVGLGWAAAEFLPKYIDAFLSAFTAGTFLYLASDSVAEEFAVGMHRQGKNYIAFLAAIALIYAVTAGSE